MTAISNHVSLAAPFGVGHRKTRIVFNPAKILNEDSKCSKLHVALCIKHTLQKKSCCLKQVSLYSTGSYLGQWY